MNDDDDTGELVPTRHLTGADSLLRPGDQVIFKVRQGPWRHSWNAPQLTGEVLEILSGHELAVLIKVHAGKLPWAPIVVRHDDCARVVF